MKKLLAILIALATVLSLCSCSASKGNEDESTNAGENAQSQNEGNTSYVPDTSYGDKKVQKIGTNTHSGYTYTDYSTKKEGVVSLDGKVDTGAKYCDIGLSAKGYYIARTKDYDTPENLDCMNSENLIDPYGNTLIEGYFDYSMPSERFVVAAKAVKVVEEGDYDMFLHHGMFAMSATEGDTKYDCDYYLYDIKTGKFVDGVVANRGDDYSAMGDFVKYKDKSGVYKTINANGYDVPENAIFLYDSNEAFYIVSDATKGTVYDSENKPVLTYDKKNDYIPSSYSNGYFKAYRSDDNARYYVLLDKTGKKVTAEFAVPSNSTTADLEAFGKVVLFSVYPEYQICDFNGNILVKSEKVLMCHTRSYFDEPQYFIFSNSDDDTIIISAEGEVLFEVYGDETYNDDTYNCVYKEVGEEIYFFCLKDKDFTIKAGKNDSKAPYLLEIDANDNLKDLVDVTTGETLIDGYLNYDCFVQGTDIYVCAQNEDHTSDIYLIRF